jgi:hypothetical protein
MRRFSVGRERAAALGGEDEGAVGGLPAQLAQSADFVAEERMRRWLTVLRPADVQRGRAAEFDLRPFEVRDLGGAQAMAIGDENQRRVTMAVAAAAGRADELSDLVRYSRERTALLGARGDGVCRMARQTKFSTSEWGAVSPTLAADSLRPTFDAPGVQLSEKSYVAPRGATLQALWNFPSDADDCPVIRRSIPSRPTIDPATVDCNASTEN